MEEEEGAEVEEEIFCKHKKDPVLRPEDPKPYWVDSDEEWLGMLQKWSVSKEKYSGSTYPTNCFGTFYLFSSQVRDRLLNAHNSLGSVFKIDDIFITGILAKEANVTHRQLSDLI